MMLFKILKFPSRRRLQTHFNTNNLSESVSFLIVIVHYIQKHPLFEFRTESRIDVHNLIRLYKHWFQEQYVYFPEFEIIFQSSDLYREAIHPYLMSSMFTDSLVARKESSSTVYAQLVISMTQFCVSKG